MRGIHWIYQEEGGSFTGHSLCAKGGNKLQKHWSTCICTLPIAHFNTYKFSIFRSLEIFSIHCRTQRLASITTAASLNSFSKISTDKQKLPPHPKYIKQNMEAIPAPKPLDLGGGQWWVLFCTFSRKKQQPRQAKPGFNFIIIIFSLAVGAENTAIHAATARFSNPNNHDPFSTVFTPNVNSILISNDLSRICDPTLIWGKEWLRRIS